MDHFKAARLKVDRSNKHIADLDSAIQSLPDRYISTVEVNPEGTRLKYVLPEEESILAEFGLMIGDCIHNLRTALDYAWGGAVQRFSLTWLYDDTIFPIRKTEKGLRETLNKGRIESAAPNLFKRIVVDIKPYAGGNDSLFRLHGLDNQDKHSLLIPILNVTVIKGLVVENQQGEIFSGDNSLITKRSPHVIEIPANHQVKDHGKPSVGVLFENGLAMEHFDVRDMLQVFAVRTIEAIEILQYVY